MKKRIIFTFAVVSCVWALLVARAFFVQVFPDEKLKDLKQRQFQTVVRLDGRRGAIIDRKGRDLALSTPAYSLFADPKLIEKKKTTSSLLAKELKTSFKYIYKKIKNPKRRFVWIRRRLSPEQANKIKSWNIKGLSFIEEWKRVYPNESLLASTLGFVGHDGQGLEGLELQYDKALKGDKQKLNVRRDARGRPLMTEGLVFAENPDGNDVKLTIDSEIQYALEYELSEAVKNFEADSATGVVLDAQTSAIRALASVPIFDANKALKVKPEIRRNRAVTDTFEPGSTVKAIVVAAALRENILQPNSKYFCENGRFQVADRVIREADANHKFGWLTVSDILAFSSNIGTAKIALELGDEKLRKALLDFGFSQRLDIDVPGEARGILHETPWNNHLLSNISFGQGMTASALQLANAYAVIANGGALNKPFIVDSIKESESGRVKTFGVQKIRQVLTPEQAANMRLMLSSVTQGGTGKNAKVNGYIVAGKTGTAQKVNPKARGYMQGAYISSFAGFIPASDPQFVIYISVDHPRKAYYGSQVAAPIFSKIASFAARKEGLAPTILSELNFKKRRPQAVAKKELEQTLRTVQEISENGQAKSLELVPDLKGLSLREVLQHLGGKELKVKVYGQGMVSETVPAAGEPLGEKDKISIFLN